MKQHRVVYKVVNGSEIDADVYLPPVGASHAGTKCPILINIHGGAFILGASEMVNRDQISDCLGRGWIVVVPNHRLCPQVDLLQGPMRDCRDLLAWIYKDELDHFVQEKSGGTQHCDLNHVFAFGTSSGGHLALSLGYDVPRLVAGIFDMYSPCNFSDPFWTSPIPKIADKLPANLSAEFLGRVFEEEPVPTRGGVSLEGQAPGAPDFSDPRQAFAFTQIAHGRVLDAIFPSKNWNLVDPVRNITPDFPPTFIVHGRSDTMVPIGLSRKLYGVLQEKGVKSGMVEVPDEEHTFAARMKVGSATWDLQRRGFDFLEGLIKG
ncbi:alpha/beta-hydrolase [Xylariaceae sp. FL0804]|nr:alpha/beta-hydrolase [Xylariaceae sp. FL0804]